MTSFDDKTLLDKLDEYIAEDHHYISGSPTCSCDRLWPCRIKEMLEEIGELAWRYLDLE